MRKYIDPEVKLIDGTSVKDLGYYVWLKSRRKVIKLSDGSKVKDVELSNDGRILFVLDSGKTYSTAST